MDELITHKDAGERKAGQYRDDVMGSTDHTSFSLMALLTASICERTWSLS